MMDDARLRRRGAAGDGRATCCGCEPLDAARPAPSADVFIRDLGPLAARVLAGPAPAFSCTVIGSESEFAPTLGRWAVDRDLVVTPGFFRIGRPYPEGCQLWQEKSSIRSINYAVCTR